jgi:hypothetical protein
MRSRLADHKPILHSAEHRTPTQIHTFLDAIEGKVGSKVPVDWGIVQTFLIEVCGVSKENTDNKDFILSRLAWGKEQHGTLRHQLLGKTLSFPFATKLVTTPHLQGAAHSLQGID